MFPCDMGRIHELYKISTLITAADHAWIPKHPGKLSQLVQQAAGLKNQSQLNRVYIQEDPLILIHQLLS